MIEINHKVSKEASNQFWCLANAKFHELYVAKGNRGRKIPQFFQLRDKLNEKKVPPINMEIGFKSKEDGEITVVNAKSSPTSLYPPSNYKRLYEIVSVDVSILIVYMVGNSNSKCLKAPNCSNVGTLYMVGNSNSKCLKAPNCSYLGTLYMVGNSNSKCLKTPNCSYVGTLYMVGNSNSKCLKALCFATVLLLSAQ